MQKNKNYKKKIVRSVGYFLIFVSLFIIIKTFYLPAKEELRYFVDNFFSKRYEVESSEENVDSSKPIFRDYSGNKNSPDAQLTQSNITIMRPIDPNFSILIPKIAANSPVIANVDTNNEPEYLSALGHGVAHALGTDFPGNNRHVFLFAHSTDYFWRVGSYNAIFYLLYKLEMGDEINIFFEGKRHKYEVFNKIIIDPSQVEYLTRQTPSEELTLQTCWPPGTTLKRLLVFARPSKVNN